MGFERTIPARFALLVLCSASLAGCVTQPAPSEQRSSSSQYLSIDSAPPTAWPADPPPKPAMLDSFSAFRELVSHPDINSKRYWRSI